MKCKSNFENFPTLVGGGTPLPELPTMLALMYGSKMYPSPKTILATSLGPPPAPGGSKEDPLTPSSGRGKNLRDPLWKASKIEK